MLNARSRLSRAEFLDVFENGRRRRLPFGQLVSSAPGEPFKATVVVSKKVHKGAFRRNRLRRQLYHLFRELRDAHDLTGHHILILHPQVTAYTIEAVRTTLDKLLGDSSFSR